MRKVCLSAYDVSSCKGSHCVLQCGPHNVMRGITQLFVSNSEFWFSTCLIGFLIRVSDYFSCVFSTDLEKNYKANGTGRNEESRDEVRIKANSTRGMIWATKHSHTDKHQNSDHRSQPRWTDKLCRGSLCCRRSNETFQVRNNTCWRQCYLTSSTYTLSSVLWLMYCNVDIIKM